MRGAGAEATVVSISDLEVGRYDDRDEERRETSSGAWATLGGTARPLQARLAKPGTTAACAGGGEEALRRG
jgi:hypothetical protein